MLLRSTKILLEIVAALVTLVVVLLAVALWRLSTGPVSVDFLTPQLERVFSGGESGLHAGRNRGYAVGRPLCLS